MSDWALQYIETLEMRAMLFCIINDFPAYGNLSGYIFKSHHACPICEENTSYIQLKHGKKKKVCAHYTHKNSHVPPKIESYYSYYQ